MGAKSQRKGRGGELELSRILQAHGIPAEPGKAVSRNQEGWRVTMALPDWLKLYRSYQPPPGSNYKE